INIAANSVDPTLGAILPERPISVPHTRAGIASRNGRVDGIRTIGCNIQPMDSHRRINFAYSPTGAHVNKRIRARSVAVGYISAEGINPIGKVRRAENE